MRLAPLLAPALALLLALPAAGPAQAHAILIDSTPALNARLPAAPLDVTLRFNSRVDQARSRLVLTSPTGEPEGSPAIAAGGPDDVIHAAIGPLAPGSYLLRWQVLAVDGHITRGDVPFTISAVAP